MLFMHRVVIRIYNILTYQKKKKIRAFIIIWDYYII